MKNAGKVVSREDLLRDAWGWEYLTETKTVDTHIKRLRDKIHAGRLRSGPRGNGTRLRLPLQGVSQLARNLLPWKGGSRAGAFPFSDGFLPTVF